MSDSKYWALNKENRLQAIDKPSFQDIKSTS